MVQSQIVDRWEPFFYEISNIPLEISVGNGPAHPKNLPKCDECKPMKIHVKSRGFHGFFTVHGLCWNPQFHLNLSICTLHPQMQNILQKEATLLRDQLGLQWQDVDWHASPSQYPRMGKFEESNHYINVRQHVNICNEPVNPWSREAVNPWNHPCRQVSFISRLGLSRRSILWHGGTELYI